MDHEMQKPTYVQVGKQSGPRLSNSRSYKERRQENSKVGEQ